jgi:hypothetical protein
VRIAGHFDLWQGGVYHRDVSVPNMMWRKDKNGTLIGVLNNYDLSSLAIAQDPQGNKCTGTVPFMALDLLSKQGQRGEIKHLYRHDLESFMWVLAWVCLHYKGGKLLTSGRPLDEWATKDAETVAKEKTFFLYHLWDYQRPGIDQHMWRLMVHCFAVLHRQQRRRFNIMIDKHERSTLAKESVFGGSAPETAEEIGLADADLLREFIETDAWFELSK